MIDLHCHIDLYENPFEIVKECISREIFVLSVTTTPSAFGVTDRIVRDCKRIRTALGLHPQIASERYSELGLFDEILPSVKYVGEIGLDGSRDYRDSWDIQQKVFSHILESINRSSGKIISLHSRGSATQVMDMMKPFSNLGTPVLHWFSGTKEELKRAVDSGYWFSVNPSMLKSKKGIEILRNIPKSRVLTETDGPFTGSKTGPYFPWDSSLCHRYLSEVWKLSEYEVRQTLLGNLKFLTSPYSDDKKN